MEPHTSLRPDDSFGPHVSLDVRICWEHRTRATPRDGTAGDREWLPRWIVWPEYDGLSADVYEERVGRDVDDVVPDVSRTWGRVVEKAVQAFATQLDLQVGAWTLVPSSAWQRWFSRKSPRWQVEGTPVFDADIVNFAQDHYDGTRVYALTPRDSGASLSRPRAESPSVADLPEGGVTVLRLGTEEAVLELCFAREERLFLRSLEDAARAQGVRVEQSAQPWGSHWDLARGGDAQRRDS